LGRPHSSTSYADHSDFYSRGPYSAFLTDRRLVGRQPVSLFRADQPPGHYPDPAFPNLLLYVALRGAKEARFDWGAGRWRGIWRRGDLTLVPRSSASDVTLSQHHAFLGICLPPSAFATDADPDGSDAISRLGPLHAGPFRDRLVLALCETLWAEADRGDPTCSLLVDSMLQCLSDRLRSLAEPQGKSPHDPRLPQAKVRRVEDYVRANLRNKVTVADLARVAGCSPSHFNALFKAATGVSPYRRVTALRLEEASALLVRQPDAHLATLALSCGFSSQSHFSQAFKSAYGTTPAKYARDVGQ
jgi:AraC family transcriptional regulator